MFLTRVSLHWLRAQPSGNGVGVGVGGVYLGEKKLLSVYTD